MTLGEILDRTFQIYRAKFLTFVGIAAVPALVMISIETANRIWWGLVPFPYDGDLTLTLLQWTIYITALYQIALLLHLLFWPAFVCLTSQLYFGERPQLTALAFRGNSRWRSWFWMAVATWGIVLILPELLIGGVAIGVLYLLSEIMKVGSDAMDNFAIWIIFSTFAAGFLVFFWRSSALFVAIPVRSLEGFTVGKALRRSWTLSKGSRLKMIFIRFSLLLTAWLLNYSLMILFVQILRWIARGHGVWLHYYRNIQTGIGSFTAFSVSLIIAPVFPIALTLIYYDQRIRKEGYDIERMMEAAGLSASAVPPEGQA
ncbi:MAG: hypothetical protein ABR991_10550 [Terracidiphilus sp.]|jgi:hypothetical protein